MLPNPDRNSPALAVGKFKAKPFKRYEYKLFEFQGGSLYSETMVAALNKIGVQGWKLVKGPSETGRLTGEWYTGLFMREKP
jgi:hypothetical protein